MKAQRSDLKLTAALPVGVIIASVLMKKNKKPDGTERKNRTVLKIPDQ